MGVIYSFVRVWETLVPMGIKGFRNRDIHTGSLVAVTLVTSVALYLEDLSCATYGYIPAKLFKSQEKYLVV